MKGKLLFVAGAAVGYVLGTRAGRKRYEQIKGAAESVWNTPVVQQGVDQVKDFALARVGSVSDAFFDNAKKLVNSATAQGKSAQAKTAQAKSAATSTEQAAGAQKSAAEKSAAPKKAATKSAAQKSTAQKSAAQKAAANDAAEADSESGS